MTSLGATKIMTNICALSFPTARRACAAPRHSARGSWHDRFRDVSDALEESSLGRIAQQADYIRESEADVVMLQEVPGASYVAALHGFLSDDFDARYAYRAPSAFAVMVWLAFTLAVSALQLIAIEPLLRCTLQPHLLLLTGGVTGRLLLAGTALRWRHSIVTQFLLGSVAGQLLVLRRRSSPLVGDLISSDGVVDAAVADAVADAGSVGGAEVTDINHREACKEAGRAKAAAAAASSPFGVIDFVTFEGSSASKPSKGYLDAFFSVRPRGVLQVSLPIVDAQTGCRSTVRVCTTHLPHASDNDSLLKGLGERTRAIAHAHGGAVVLGGDFNPLPSPGLAEQFAPLVAAGCVPTNPLSPSPGNHAVPSPLPSPRHLSIAIQLLPRADEARR